MGSDGSPGYQHFVNLAQSLVSLWLVGYVTQAKEVEILGLWDKLPERDRGPVQYPQWYKDHLSHGRLKKPKSGTHNPTDVASTLSCNETTLS